MRTVLLDTHTWVWTLFQSSSLDPVARALIEAAQLIYVAPCSFHEITQKHRSGKWPEVDGIIQQWDQHGTKPPTSAHPQAHRPTLRLNRRRRVTRRGQRQ